MVLSPGSAEAPAGYPYKNSNNRKNRKHAGDTKTQRCLWGGERVWQVICLVAVWRARGVGWGVLNKCLYGEAPLALRSNPLPFSRIYLFCTKRVPLSNTLIAIDKWYPFHIPCLRLCILFDCTVFLNRNQSQNRTFFRLNKAIKFICQPFWALSQTQMLPTEYITIQWIGIKENNCVILWIEIYPVESTFHPVLNDWGQGPVSRRESW